MLSSVQQIEPSKLTSDPAVQEVIYVLLNIIEQQASQIEGQAHRIEALESELKRIKTGQGNAPKSQGKQPLPREDVTPEKSTPVNKNHKSGSKREQIQIDRRERLDMDRSELPADAVFKGYREVLVQNLILKRDNVLYEVAEYYSRSEKKQYSAKIPNYQGGVGTELRTILQTLRHVCDVTEGSLQKLLQSTGVQISSGGLNNILLSPSKQMQQESADILRAGIQNSPYAGMDGTKSFEKGKRLSTQIICGEYFSVFLTMPGKSRLDILCALQGKARNGLLFHYNECTQYWLQYFEVGKKHRALLGKSFAGKAPFDRASFLEQLKGAGSKLPNSKAFERVADAFALGHYHAQQDFPVVQLLMSDQGREYIGVAAIGQAFCWLHDERHYRLLNPKLNIHRRAVDDFLNQYWAFYRKLLNFKELPAAQQQENKACLNEQFDQLFTKKTTCDILNQQIKKTFEKKQQLLLSLEHPFLPLHNNAAELAVRRKVRKRDISLHTMSELGTKTQDAFMTVVHTAVKLGISAFEYIADRVSQRFNMVALAELVTQSYKPFAPAF